MNAATDRRRQEVARRIRGGLVSGSIADRAAYARDLWPRDLLGLTDGTLPPGPELIAWPGTVDEVAALVTFARNEGMTVVPFGGGAGVCGAARATEPSRADGDRVLVLDLKRLRRLRSVERANGTAEVETGIVGEILERALNARGATLGHFPSSIYCSTLGGFVAGRSAGQLSTKYGKIEEMVLGLELVLPDGEIVRTDDTTGPELSQLFVGAEGTLGVATAARLRIHRLAECQRLRAYSFASIDDGIQAIRTVLQAGLRPAVVRLYDEFDTLLALAGKEHAPGDGSGLTALLSPKRLGGSILGLFPGLGKRAVATLLQNPRLLNRIADAVPGRCLLVLMFEGARTATLLEEAETERLLSSRKATDLGPAPAERWKRRRYAISYRQSKVFAAGAFNDTAEVAASWERLPRLYREVKQAIGRNAFVMAHLSHAYAEGCSIYFTFVSAGRDAADGRRIYDQIWSDLLAATLEAGGTISHHHGVGLSKARFLPEELGPGGMTALKAVKRSLDPQRTFNPGRLGL